MENLYHSDNVSLDRKGIDCFILTLGETKLEGTAQGIYNEILSVARAGHDLDRIMTNLMFGESRIGEI